MYPCKKCLENNWKFLNKKEIYKNMIRKWIEAECVVCGEIVQFGFKEKKLNENKYIKLKQHYLT